MEQPLILYTAGVAPFGDVGCTLSDQATSAVTKEIAQHLRALQRFTRSLPYVVSVPVTRVSDPVTKLMVGARILEVNDGGRPGTNSSVAGLTASIQDSHLILNYCPSWLVGYNQTSCDASVTEYDTPVCHSVVKLGSEPDQQVEQRLQDIRELMLAARDILYGRGECASSVDPLMALNQALVLVPRLLNNGRDNDLAQILSDCIYTDRAKEHEALDRLPTTDQIKLLSAEVLRVAAFVCLYVSTEVNVGAALPPALTGDNLTTVLALHVDLLQGILYEHDEHSTANKNQIQLLEVSTQALHNFYSSVCKPVPAHRMLNTTSSPCILSMVNKDTIYRHVHLLLSLMESRNVGVAISTSCTRILSILYTNDHTNSSLAKALISPFYTETLTTNPSKAVLNKTVDTLLAHVIEGTIHMPEELHKTQLVYADVLTEKNSAKVPSLFSSISRLLQIESPDGCHTRLFAPKLVFQCILQHITAIASQQTILKDSLTMLLAFTYHYLTVAANDVANNSVSAGVVWKEFPSMIVALCDKQLQSNLPSSAVVAFIRTMLDLLGFLILLSQRNSSCEVTKQAGTHLLTFFLSFFSIISKSLQLQIHIIVLLTRLSSSLATAIISALCVDADHSKSLLALIDSYLMDIVMQLLSNANCPVSLLDSALMALVEPLRNFRFTHEYIGKIDLVPKLQSALRMTGSLQLIKTITHLFVTLTNCYYVDSLVKSSCSLSLVTSLNSMMSLVMSTVIFTKINTVALAIASLLLPAMRAALPSLGLVWQTPENKIAKAIGLLICITSQNESRLLSFFRVIISLDPNHRVILRDIQREVFRLMRNLLYRSDTSVGLSLVSQQDTEDIACAHSFSEFFAGTLGNVLFNFVGFSSILGKELGDDREGSVPFCSTQKDQCICSMNMQKDIELDGNDASQEPRVKATLRNVPPYVRVSFAQEGSKGKAARQSRRATGVPIICHANSTISIFFAIISVLTDVIPAVVQRTPLSPTTADWLEEYLTGDEQRRIFLTHAFKTLALGSRMHIHCLVHTEQSGRAYGFQTHMTAGNMRDQYNRVVSLCYLIMETADVHTVEHIVSCLVQYVAWDISYRYTAGMSTQSMQALCNTYVRVCADVSLLLVQAGFLTITSELVCLKGKHLTNKDTKTNTPGTLTRHLYLLTLLAKEFERFPDNFAATIQTTLARVLSTVTGESMGVNSLGLAYSTPTTYMLRLLSHLRVNVPSLVQPIAVCQYTLLGALPLLFIQTTNEAADMRAALKSDCTQIALHPLIAGAVFDATTRFFSLRITEDVISSVSVSTVSEDMGLRDSQRSTPSISTLSTVKSLSSTDYEKTITDVYDSAKMEENRLHIQKRFVNTTIPYCNAVLEEYCFRNIFSAAVRSEGLVVKTLVHVLHCIRQIIVSKLVLPEHIVPEIMAFQLTACHNRQGKLLMPAAYEDTLDSLVLSLTVFRQTVCILAAEKALEILFSSRKWQELLEHSKKSCGGGETEHSMYAILQTVQVSGSIAVDLYNILFLEGTGQGNPKQRDADTLFVSSILNCLKLPDETSSTQSAQQPDLHDILLRLFFIVGLLIRLPFNQHKSAAAVGVAISYFSDYSIRNFQRIQELECTGGEMLAHTFSDDLLGYLLDCMYHFLTAHFDYTSRGLKEEIGREPRDDYKLFTAMMQAASDCVTGNSMTLQALIEIKGLLV